MPAYMSECRLTSSAEGSPIAERLDPKILLRIHRSAIVNIRRIKEIQPCLHGHYLVFLDGGTKLRMGRYQRELPNRFGL
jgi:two-component system, LytTR family, response regulator